MWEIIGIPAAIIWVVAAISLELELGPKDPRWRRRWAIFVYSAMGLFVLWMFVLFVIVK